MAVFYATLVSTYISYFLARIAYEKKYRLIAIMFSIIVALILIFVSGLRSGIGDTGMYMHSYKILVQNYLDLLEFNKLPYFFPNF